MHCIKFFIGIHWLIPNIFYVLWHIILCNIEANDRCWITI